MNGKLEYEKYFTQRNAIVNIKVLTKGIYLVKIVDDYSVRSGKILKL